MPSATPLKQREEIVAMRQKGASFAHISREMSMSYRTVYNVWQHFEQTGCLEPAYDRCAHRGIRKDPRIYAKAIEFKQAHPRWGAGLIWVELAEHFPENELPSIRTLQRWFHRGGVASQAPADKRPPIHVVRGETAHEVWAMDAKEQMTLADGTKASWLIISDEGSGAILHGDLFPHKPMDSGESHAGQNVD